MISRGKDKVETDDEKCKNEEENKEIDVNKHIEEDD